MALIFKVGNSLDYDMIIFLIIETIGKVFHDRIHTHRHSVAVVCGRQGCLLSFNVYSQQYFTKWPVNGKLK